MSTPNMTSGRVQRGRQTFAKDIEEELDILGNVWCFPYPVLCVVRTGLTAVDVAVARDGMVHVNDVARRMLHVHDGSEKRPVLRLGSPITSWSTERARRSPWILLPHARYTAFGFDAGQPATGQIGTNRATSMLERASAV